MELCYREQLCTDDENETRVATGLVVFAVAIPFFVLIVLSSPSVISQFIRWSQSVPGLHLVLGLLGGVLAATLLVAFLMLTGSGIQAALLPVVTVPLATSGVAHVFPASRGVLTVLLALSALGLVRTASALIVSFYKEWLASDIRLGGEEHVQFLREPLNKEMCQPGATLCIAFGVAVALGPANLLSITFAALFTVVVLLHSRPLRTLTEARKVLASFYTYRAPISGAAGVFIPSSTLNRRLVITSQLATVLYTTVTLAFLRSGSPYQDVADNVLLAPVVVLTGNVSLLVLLSNTFRTTFRLRETTERLAGGE
jgi:hypothetical protein